MAVYGLCLNAELFVLLITDVLALNLLPALDFVEGADNAAEFTLLEVDLPERVAAFAQRPLEACLERVEQVTQLVVCFLVGFAGLGLAKKDRPVD